MNKEHRFHPGRHIQIWVHLSKKTWIHVKSGAKTTAAAGLQKLAVINIQFCQTPKLTDCFWVESIPEKIAFNMLATSPLYSDSDESIISTNSVQVWGPKQIFIFREIIIRPWEYCLGFKTQTKKYFWDFFLDITEFHFLLNFYLTKFTFSKSDFSLLLKVHSENSKCDF